MRRYEGEMDWNGRGKDICHFVVWNWAVLFEGMFLALVASDIVVEQHEVVKEKK